MSLHREQTIRCSDSVRPLVVLIALLLAALVIIRLMPDGVSAVLQRLIDRRNRFA